MQFEYFRFLLSPIKEPHLPFVETTREKVVDEIFSKTCHFKSGRAKYGFLKISRRNGIVHARIGKATKKKLYASPDHEFAEKHEEDWPGCHLFINLRDEKDTGKTVEAGQILAMESKKSAISDSVACLRSFAEKINEEIAHKGFFVSINPIPTARQNFWKVVDKYKGDIKKVVIVYSPPNIFNLENSLEKDLKKANKTYNTTSTQIVLENDSGNLDLPKSDELLNQSAEWVDLGNGSYQVHLKKGRKIIRSESSVKTEIFDGIEALIEGEDSKGISALMKQIIEASHD